MAAKQKTKDQKNNETNAREINSLREMVKVQEERIKEL